MNSGFARGRISVAAVALLAAILAASALASASRTTAVNAFVVHNLVSDVPGMADHTDPNLVNAWGLDALPMSPWWVADNHTDYSTIYQADGTPNSLVVQVPGGPTGLVANPGASFVVSEDGNSGPARFLFDTEEGKILGWNPGVALNHAVVSAGQFRRGGVHQCNGLTTHGGVRAGVGGHPSPGGAKEAWTSWIGNIRDGAHDDDSEIGSVANVRCEWRFKVPGRAAFQDQIAGTT